MPRRYRKNPKRKKGMSKKDACIIHTKKRGGQRFGIEMTKNVQKRLVDMITGKVTISGKPAAVLESKQPPSCARWFVWYEGRWLLVVYNKVQKCLVTVLQKEASRIKPPLPLN